MPFVGVQPDRTATREDIDGWADHLSDAGIQHSGVIEIPAGAILNFRDPDGIQLAIFWEAAS